MTELIGTKLNLEICFIILWILETVAWIISIFLLFKQNLSAFCLYYLCSLTLLKVSEYLKNVINLQRMETICCIRGFKIWPGKKKYCNMEVPLKWPSESIQKVKLKGSFIILCFPNILVFSESKVKKTFYYSIRNDSIQITTTELYSYCTLCIIIRLFL